MNKTKKITIIIMIIVFILIFIISSYILIKNFLDYKEIENETIKLIEEVVNIQEDDEKSDDMVIDWEMLENINKDIVGWIKIEDTKIDYPIMQDKDLYYMNHTFEKKYNRNGSIFIKISNPFKTKETIIYGHNNKNGLMFAGIQHFMEEDFFYNHPTFKIYTKSGIYNANVFSIYSIGVKEESDNTKNLDFNETIQYYKKQSKFKVECEETPQNIVKLSTCSYINNTTTPTNQRYFLVASITKNN